MAERIALVTGASRGIGKAVAIRLAADGNFVIVNYQGSKDKAEAVVKEIEAAGGSAIAYQCNVSDAKQCEAMMNDLIRTYKKIDILVNNAGITRDGLLMAMSEEDFDAVIDTNLKGAFLTIRYGLRPMVRQKFGRIINMSSVSGIMGNAGQTNYSASKAGLIGLTKTAAKEYAKKGITVNAVAPGFIATDMTEVLSDEVKEQACRQIPLGRFGKPEDIAAAVSFLASDEAGYITGQVISVDGGICM